MTQTGRFQASKPNNNTEPLTRATNVDDANLMLHNTTDPDLALSRANRGIRRHRKSLRRLRYTFQKTKGRANKR